MNATVHIHLNRLQNNLEVIKDQLSNNEQVFAVVKDYAYGHGLIPIAKFLEAKVFGFCVARVDEAVELRKAGITKPILVFELPEAETAKLYVEYSIIASAADVRAFEVMLPDTEYHINFNTGMNRLGFDTKDVLLVKEFVDMRADCTPTGIYTHFYKSDDPGNTEVEQQLSEFRKILIEFPGDWMAHTSNSGGIFHYKALGTNSDAVRPGISLYGYSPGTEKIEGLEPVLELHSSVAQVKKIQKGDTVSYGARWIAPKDGYVATIPLGYNAGISRLLSGKIKVNIQEKLYPQVGTISMDYMMVFLGDDKISVGSAVEILGKKSMCAGDWANLTDTISYEIITQLNWRIPRVIHS